MLAGLWRLTIAWSRCSSGCGCRPTNVPRLSRCTFKNRTARDIPTALSPPRWRLTLDNRSISFVIAYYRNWNIIRRKTVCSSVCFLKATNVVHKLTMIKSDKNFLYPCVIIIAIHVYLVQLSCTSCVLPYMCFLNLHVDGHGLASYGWRHRFAFGRHPSRGPELVYQHDTASWSR